MRYEHAERQTGKTTKLLHWFFSKPDTRYILVSTEDRRRNLIETATGVLLYEYETNPDYRRNTEEAVAHARLAGLHITTFRMYKQRMVTMDRRRNEIEIAVDELCDVFYSALGCIPDIVTGSTPVVVFENSEVF